MANINFNLKNASSKKDTAIYLIFNFDNQRIKVSTGISILPAFWNKKTQRIRESMEFPEHADHNENLEDQSRIMLKLYHDYRKQGILVDAKTLRKEFTESFENPNRNILAVTFWDHFDKFIEYKKSQLKDVRDYERSLFKHLMEAEKRYGKMLSYSAIKDLNKGFIEVFEHYLTYEAINAKGEKGLTTNTVGKQLKNLKVFLNWSFDREIFPRFSLKHIVTRTEDVDSVYLTEDELERFANLRFDDPDVKTNEHDEIVRDLFVIGCETALRFSDYSRLTKAHIRNNQIHIRPKKTEGNGNNKVVIPISSRLNAILKKYDYNPPTYKSQRITEFNKTLRRIAERAEVDADIIITRKIAGKITQIVHKKHELISSHTCRRTFCTLKFLSKMPAQVIMKFSGHKTEAAFMRYLKIDAEMAAKQYKEFFK